MGGGILPQWKACVYLWVLWTSPGKNVSPLSAWTNNLVVCASLQGETVTYVLKMTLTCSFILFLKSNGSASLMTWIVVGRTLSFTSKCLRNELQCLRYVCRYWEGVFSLSLDNLIRKRFTEEWKVGFFCTKWTKIVDASKPVTSCTTDSWLLWPECLLRLYCKQTLTYVVLTVPSQLFLNTDKFC